MTDAAQTLFERLRAECGDEWAAYVNHPFVEQLAAGELAESSFRHYLVQDYLFLTHFARAWALAVFKAEHVGDMRSAAAVLHGLLEHEMSLHVEYCARWGIERETLERTREARANMAYTRYVLERGLAGDALDLLAALAPCVCGYAEIGRERIRHAATRLEGNPYRDWLELYAGEEFQRLAESVKAQMQQLARQRAGPERFAGLAKTFRDATRLEVGFWEMGMHREL